MKKLFVPVVAVMMFGAISANAQSAGQSTKPQPKPATTTAQKATVQAAKPAATTSAATAQKPASQQANPAIASTTPKTAKAETAKPKKAHHLLHRKAISQNSSQPSAGTTDKAPKKAKSGKN